jgi:exosome complex RNA-binding protein Rrp42 (RNase PH superfamily)
MLKDLPIHLLRPREYLNALIKNDIRPDGRSLNQSRPVIVKNTPPIHSATSFVASSKQAQIGGSVVFAAATVLVGTPAPNFSEKGDIGMFFCY